uniref:BCAR3 adaptor protein, NSP family member n=1 Tax=Denticeps clupeoides TaxID=299321 RepID=A0AAY4EXC9_9TELE
MAEGRFASLPRNMHMGRQCPLASSMDLLKARPALTAELPAVTGGYQGFSIHGTLPRRKKGAPVRCWDGYGHDATLSPPALARGRLHSSQLIHNVIEEHQPLRDLQDSCSTYRDPCCADPTMEYVKFSRDKYIMDGPPEKLRKELEEELKLSGEEPRSHAWYHGAIPRQVAENLVQRDGDFLIRDSVSSPGNYVLTCQWKNSPQHFKINKKVVAMNESYSRVQYLLEKEGFDSVPALVRYYVGNRRPVSEVVGAIIFQPINRSLPLRCLEERYGVRAIRPEGGHHCERKSQTPKRLSLNIVNGHCQDPVLGHGNLLSNKDKCGSQPACLNYVPERRRPLKTHQSESFLSLGSRPPPKLQPSELQPSAKSPVFRTGSEPALSPTVPRRMILQTQAGEAIRGSDSQLCPKPPPKPSKVPSLKQQQCPSYQEISYCELSPCSTAEREQLNGQAPCNSSYHIEYEKEKREEDKDGVRRGEGEVKEEKRGSFRRPVYETESAFRPADFKSRLLPSSENKPLEMTVLRRAKELLLSHDHKSIAKHILQADCQVARMLHVSDEMKSQMGVSSGLELVTLPHGRQLRQDLMERHHTMAVGVAVDILGCTGSLEERAATLNRIILVALELKDTMGDMFAFSSIMKALDMPQITRLDHTWTTLRRKYTQTAIIYEKSLKPFYKGLYEGTVPLSSTTVPLLMPLLTLMERPAVAFEGMELWESNDQGCEIMLRHLEEARGMAQNVNVYSANAERLLQDFSPDEDMLEILKTDFQLRLLWGSRGAAVNQTERYEKFTLILTALSRKLESPVKHTEL